MLIILIVDRFLVIGIEGLGHRSESNGIFTPIVNDNLNRQKHIDMKAYIIIKN